MKRIITISLLCFLASCGSSKGHCDAYGNKNAVEDADYDIHSLQNQEMSKYVTTTPLK